MMSMLPELTVLIAFVGASLALNVTPGADLMFAIANGAANGPRSAIAASLGINLGVVLHIVLAAAGLAVLIETSPVLYDAIRYLGAAYLVWLAISMWRAPPPDLVKGQRTKWATIMRRGFITNVLNPKTALFIFAFLPQFADPDRGPIWLQIAVLGAIFIATGFTVNAVFGAVAGAAAGRIRAAAPFMNKFSAFIFGGLAARLVID